MDGSISLRWPARFSLSGTSGLLIRAAAVGAFVGANVFAYHLGASARRAAVTFPVAPAASRPASSAVIDQTIRVLLFDQAGDCRIGVDRPFEIVDSTSRKVLLRSSALDLITVRFDGDGVRLIELDQGFPPGAIDLVPVEPARIRVETPRGPRVFCGSLRFWPQSSAAGAVINVLDMEDYLLGVVPAEVPRSFHAQAMRAQAIIARTYAWYARLTTGASREWDVWSTETSQMYIGLPREPGPASRAVRDTRGVVCTWNAPGGQRIFCTFYSSTCGGSTLSAHPAGSEQASIRPLAGGVRCEHCARSPVYRWEPVRLEKSFITQRLRDKYAAFRRLGRIESMHVVAATPEGRPVRFALSDKNGQTVELGAENFRLSVDPTGRTIRSTFFVPLVDKDTITLSGGRGFGHGMGLCQYGAAALAESGWQAAQILRFYYPGSQLARAY